MNKYENLLNDLLFGAKDLIDQTKSVADKFEMSVKLAKEVRKAMEVMNQPVNVAQAEQPMVEQIAAQKQVHLALDKEQYEKVLGYKISQAAYDEYVDIFNRQAAGEEINLWIPDPDGIQSIPEGARVSLAIQESPMYKHLFKEEQEEQQEEVVVEEPVAIEEDEIPIPTNVTAEVAEEIENMSVEEVVKKSYAPQVVNIP